MFSGGGTVVVGTTTGGANRGLVLDGGGRHSLMVGQRLAARV